jgi:hypothetical protein
LRGERDGEEQGCEERAEQDVGAHAI